jgi:lysozyme
MKTSAAGRAFLTRWEGVRLDAYRCSAKVLTIGVGHALIPSERDTGTIMIGGVAQNWRNGITRDQADTLLSDDLVRFERAVNDLDTELDQHQFDALVSFAFNVGVAAFRESTLARFVAERNFVQVPKELGRWTRAAGRVIKGLQKRRQAEGKLFTTGDYTGSP